MTAEALAVLLVLRRPSLQQGNARQITCTRYRNQRTYLIFVLSLGD